MTLIDKIRNGEILRISFPNGCDALGISAAAMRRRIDAGELTVQPDTFSGRLFFDAAKFLDYYQQQPEFSCTAAYVKKEKIRAMEHARARKKK